MPFNKNDPTVRIMLAFVVILVLICVISPSIMILYIGGIIGRSPYWFEDKLDQYFSRPISLPENVISFFLGAAPAALIYVCFRKGDHKSQFNFVGVIVVVLTIFGMIFGILSHIYIESPDSYQTIGLSTEVRQNIKSLINSSLQACVFYAASLLGLSWRDR